MPHVQKIKEDIKYAGSEALFYNINAADAVKRNEVIEELKKKFDNQPKIKVIMHSLAFGTLKPFISIDK